MVHSVLPTVCAQTTAVSTVSNYVDRPRFFVLSLLAGVLFFQFMASLSVFFFKRFLLCANDCCNGRDRSWPLDTSTPKLLRSLFLLCPVSSPPPFLVRFFVIFFSYVCR